MTQHFLAQTVPSRTDVSRHVVRKGAVDEPARMGAVSDDLLVQDGASHSSELPQSGQYRATAYLAIITTNTTSR